MITVLLSAAIIANSIGIMFNALAVKRVLAIQRLMR